METEDCLYPADRVPLILLILIGLREAAMIAGASILWKRKVDFAADKFGKVTTVMFFASTALLYPWHNNETVIIIGKVLMAASVVSSFTAFGHYCKLYFERMKKNTESK